MPPSPARFIIAFLSVTIVGLGSVAFHGTLLFEHQRWDQAHESVLVVFALLLTSFPDLENEGSQKWRGDLQVREWFQGCSHVLRPLFRYYKLAMSMIVALLGRLRHVKSGRFARQPPL